MPFFEVDIVDNKTMRYVIEAEDSEHARHRAEEMSDTEMFEVSLQADDVATDHYIDIVRECDKP